MNKIPFLIFLGFTFIFFSCKRQTSGIKWDFLDKNRLEIKEVDFDYFSAKSRIKFKDSDSNLSSSANIRIKKDSIIWFSVTPALGIEAARGIITQDSIIILNRLEKVYIAHDYKSLSAKYNFDISYDLLQAILLGNMPLELNSGDLVERADNFYVVKQEDGLVNVDNYVSARTMKLERVEMVENPTKNTLSLIYGQFQMLDEYAIPHSSVISLNYKSPEGDVKNTRIEIDFSKAEIAEEALNFPFNIPQKYERK